MGIGFGPGSEMLKTVKTQKSYSNKRSLKDSSEMTLAGKNADKALRFKDSTPELIEEIRAEMQAIQKRNTIISVVLTTVFIGSILLIFMFL